MHPYHPKAFGVVRGGRTSNISTGEIDCEGEIK